VVKRRVLVGWNWRRYCEEQEFREERVFWSDRRIELEG